MPTYAPGQFLGLSNYRLKAMFPGGPIGSRWIVETAQRGASGLADVVSVDSEYMKTLCQNAEITCGLTDGPNVVNVLEAGWPLDAVYFQVTDLGMDARPITDVWSGGGITGVQLWDAASGIIAGLIHLHRREIVHGALCPSAVYSDAGELRIGELWWAHTADQVPFQRDLASYLPDQLPRQAMPFMAPEVLNGAAPTRESDVYSLGAVLYFLLTGRAHRDAPPVPDNAAFRKDLFSSNIQALDEIRPDVDDTTVGLIHSMLDKDVGSRPSILLLEPLAKHLSGKHIDDQETE